MALFSVFPARTPSPPAVESRLSRTLWNRATLILVSGILCVCGCANPDVESAPADGVPDYSRLDSWAAHPDRPGASAVVPDGASKAELDKVADVFFVHPTTFKSTTEWNQRLDDEATNAWTDASVIARQAGVFNACCRVFAPRYRAGSSMAASDRLFEGRGAEAYDLAYSDVLRAFDTFIEQYSDGRPFILAGHSQGGLMLARLLKDRIDGAKLQQRMVAAYPIGYNFSVGLFDRVYQTLQPCQRPDQVGCVLSWNAMIRDADLDRLRLMAGERYTLDYGTDDGAEMLCVNPLTFDMTRPTADMAASKGAVPGEPGDGPMRRIVAGKVAATCEAGILIVEAASELELEPLASGTLHYHEYGLFYENIRQNALTRIYALEQR